MRISSSAIVSTLALGDRVDEAVLVRDAARPVALEAVLERLGLADHVVPVTLDVGDQGVDQLEDLAAIEGVMHHRPTSSWSWSCRWQS
jgi:2-C-methyl-D-erythritol 4-phosphate cytidylyltransferase